MDDESQESLKLLFKEAGSDFLENIPLQNYSWEEVANAARIFSNLIEDIENLEPKGSDIAARTMMASFIAYGNAEAIKTGRPQDRLILAAWADELIVFSELNREVSEGIFAPALTSEFHVRIILWSTIMVERIPQRLLAPNLTN